jgi:hypothetical protein
MGGRMERWMWFESANASGKWIIVQGYAEVTRTGQSLNAVLRISSDTSPHYNVDATCSETGDIKAIVSGNVPTFELQGVENSGESRQGKTTSIILTDGYTVIGLTNGPWSDQENLA